ncbi:Glycosyltransferase Family 34 [Madurella fahalii]|uniref:Glycosyltransferase Family 34 n=1 Tax=Madurella fahalii TaxID=1157608 RepID=A0ABQ0GJV0_9PEZI
MNCLALAGHRRFFNRQVLFVGLAICVLWFLVVQLRGDAAQQWSRLGIHLPDSREQPQRMPTENILPPLAKRVSCYGPRGHLLGNSSDDDLLETEMNGPYPTPWAGSFEELGLDLTIMTADGRYGPYGFGEEKEDYGRERVDWDKVDWGKLQNDCFERNKERFPAAAKPLADTRLEVRFSYRKNSQIPAVRHWHEFQPSRRTAIVVRVWRGYKYMPEDLYYLRSLVAETTLKSGGEYQVILLVDMKDYDGYENEIFASKEAYEQGLQDAGVPPEFQSITLLWDNRLLDSWYPEVTERRTMWQVFQPMQLLALHYPEFDHFWQLEMDMRFLGDAGKFLDRMTMVARNEPRKQALERANFWHMIAETGDYGEFSLAVDKANKGGSRAWGPMRVREILPIGPEPPFADPVNDTFQWGVGEEADAIVTSYCNDANKPNKWPFRDWIYGFRTGVKTPRFYCPPAISRASRPLLLVIHQAQLEQAIQVPSEATLPSFAVWHGLKLSFPQHPVFHRENDNEDIRSKWWKGGPRASSTGLGPDSLDHPRGMGLTFWWESDWPRQIFSAWTGVELPEGTERPWLIHEQDGQLYVPNIVLHPMKHIT